MSSLSQFLVFKLRKTLLKKKVSKLGYFLLKYFISYLNSILFIYFHNVSDSLNFCYLIRKDSMSLLNVLKSFGLNICIV